MLFALAWIADDLVRDQFRAWREYPPPWRSHLYVAPHEYAHEAGWELTMEGGRRELYRQRGVTVSRYTQEAELKDLRADYPEFAAIHSHVLQDVLARLEKTYQAFFRRIQRGEKAGFPRFKGKGR
jgi:transposase